MSSTNIVSMLFSLLTIVIGLVTYCASIKTARSKARKQTLALLCEPDWDEIYSMERKLYGHTFLHIGAPEALSPDDPGPIAIGTLSPNNVRELNGVADHVKPLSQFEGWYDAIDSAGTVSDLDVIAHKAHVMAMLMVNTVQKEHRGKMTNPEKRVYDCLVDIMEECDARIKSLQIQKYVRRKVL